MLFMSILTWTEFMLDPIVDYAIHVYFPWTVFMMKPIAHYAIHVNFDMDGIYV